MHFVKVVKRRARHRRARYHDRIELGNRREHACPAHLHSDVAQQRSFFFRRELEGDGPTRGTRRKAHLRLQRERVHFHDHAVDFVRQRFAATERLFAERVHLCCGLAASHVRVHMEARLAEPFQQLPLARRLERPLVRNGVHERRQVAPLRDLRVLLAQTARCRIARVGERRTAVLFRCRVQGLEACLRHVHLATQLDGGRRVFEPGQPFGAQAQRHVAHRPDVHRHVLPRRAVTARGSADQHAVLVGERNRAPVDLQLAHQRHFAAERFFRTLEPGVQFVKVHGVVKRVHALFMDDGRELFAHVAAHTLGWRRRITELWMRRLQFAQLAHERIERRVGNDRRVKRIVQVGMVLYLAAQRFNARAGVAGCSSKLIRTEQAFFLDILMVRHERVLCSSHEKDPRAGVLAFLVPLYRSKLSCAC